MFPFKHSVFHASLHYYHCLHFQLEISFNFLKIQLLECTETKVRYCCLVYAFPANGRMTSLSVILCVSVCRSVCK